MEGYKKKAIVLLGEYHKREAQIKLLEIEYQAMEQLTPGVSAVSYDQVSAYTNKISSMVESEIARLESLPDQLKELNEKIVLLRLKNQQIDIVLDAMPEPYKSLLRLRYIDRKPWTIVCQKCVGYSEKYIRGYFKDKALEMFINLYYPEKHFCGKHEAQ